MPENPYRSPESTNLAVPGKTASKPQLWQALVAVFGVTSGALLLTYGLLLLVLITIQVLRADGLESNMTLAGYLIATLASAFGAASFLLNVLCFRGKWRLALVHWGIAVSIASGFYIQIWVF